MSETTRCVLTQTSGYPKLSIIKEIVPDAIAMLEFLFLLMEKRQRSSMNEFDLNRFQDSQFIKYRAPVLKEIKKENNCLKDASKDWLSLYAYDEDCAISCLCMAAQFVRYIRRKISKTDIYKTNDEKYSNTFLDILCGTKYERLTGMIELLGSVICSEKSRESYQRIKNSKNKVNSSKISKKTNAEITKPLCTPKENPNFETITSMSTDAIAKMEFMLLILEERERSNTRNLDPRKFEDANFISSMEPISKAVKKENNQLKDASKEWILLYAYEEESAISCLCMGVTFMRFIRDKIKKTEVFQKNNEDYMATFVEVLSGTKYERIINMIDLLGKVMVTEKSKESYHRVKKKKKVVDPKVSLTRKEDGEGPNMEVPEVCRNESLGSCDSNVSSERNPCVGSDSIFSRNMLEYMDLPPFQMESNITPSRKQLARTCKQIPNSQNSCRKRLNVNIEQMWEGSMGRNNVGTRLVRRRIITGYDWSQTDDISLSDHNNHSNVSSDSDWSDTQDGLLVRQKQSHQHSKFQTTNIPPNTETFRFAPSTYLPLENPLDTFSVIPPSQDCTAIRMMQDIVEFAFTISRTKFLKDTLDGNRYHDTLKQIDGKAMEFYLSSSTKNTKHINAFDDLLYYPLLKEKKYASRSTAQNFRKSLIQYISNSLPDQNIHSVSLLLTSCEEDSVDQPVTRQWTRIDSGPQISQGIVILHDNTDPTLIYQPSFPITNNVAALKEFWAGYFSPDNALWKIMYQSQELIDTINQFGHLLNHDPQNARYMNMVDTNIEPGTIIHFPGNTIHAGPGLQNGKRSRAIVFFAATQGKSALEYNPDTQYNALTLLCKISTCAWTGITKRDRLMLLYIMNSVIMKEHSSPSDCCQHVCNATLSLFVHMSWTFFRRLERNMTSTKAWRKVLNKMSNFNSLLPDDVQLLPINFIRRTIPTDYYALLGSNLSEYTQQDIFKCVFSSQKRTNIEPAKSEDSCFERVEYPKSSILPQVCHIEFERLLEICHRRFLSINTNSVQPEFAAFQVKSIEADGNCLYRAISSSKAMKNGITRPTHKRLRAKLHEYVLNHEELALKLWRSHNFRSDDDALYQGWKKKLGNDGTWGGYTEIILLSCMLKKKIVSICYRDKKLEIFDASRDLPKTEDYMEALRKSDSYIFIWNHLLENPKGSLEPNQTPNHFSLIEYDKDATDCSGLYFPKVPKVKKGEECVIDLVTPPRKKS